MANTFKAPDTDDFTSIKQGYIDADMTGSPLVFYFFAAGLSTYSGFKAFMEVDGNGKLFCMPNVLSGTNYIAASNNCHAYFYELYSSSDGNLYFIILVFNNDYSSNGIGHTARIHYTLYPNQVQL